ncbi:MAG TPA: hypothetical protein VLL54_20220 [Pyrinomonadaceae bacterium]|nr:hypothetical protein [Pyrinomonadaceae bacterium]
MSRSEIAIRQTAILRGVQFIYDFACKPLVFQRHGSGLLSCFHHIATTAGDKKLKDRATRFGRERAEHWRTTRQQISTWSDAETVLDFILGSDAADRLGVPDPIMNQRLEASAKQFSVREYLQFDPLNEPPPADIPELCKCGGENARARKKCRDCKRPLTWISRYQIWYHALCLAHNSECYGIDLGAQSRDILKWLPVLRPYPDRANDANDDFFDSVYAVTHLIYALNDYNACKLSPRFLPQEYSFLKTNLLEALEMRDVEMVGEIVDCLKAFGLKDAHPLISSGREFLLRSQNLDGSWGARNADHYTRYHSTWVAIDGLRDFGWQPRRKFLKSCVCREKNLKQSSRANLCNHILRRRGVFNEIRTIHGGRRLRPLAD